MSKEFHEFFVLFFQIFVNLTLFQNKKFKNIYILSRLNLTQAPIIFLNTYWLVKKKITIQGVQQEMAAYMPW